MRVDGLDEDNVDDDDDSDGPLYEHVDRHSL